MPLSAGWICYQLADGKLPLVGLEAEDAGLRWSVFWKVGKEQNPEKIKNIVSHAQYEKVEVEPDRTFLIRKSMSLAERASYLALLKEYTDVFAWSPDDLQGIPPELGLHHIPYLELEQHVFGCNFFAYVLKDC